MAAAVLEIGDKNENKALQIAAKSVDEASIDNANFEDVTFNMDRGLNTTKVTNTILQHGGIIEGTRSINGGIFSGSLSTLTNMKCDTPIFFINSYASAQC